jgi:hypothetical protein
VLTTTSSLLSSAPPGQMEVCSASVGVQLVHVNFSPTAFRVQSLEEFHLFLSIRGHRLQTCLSVLQ